MVVKKKFKNLKDRYRKEKSKISIPRSGAAGSSMCTESRWPYFNMLGFLDDSIPCEPTEDNILDKSNVDLNIQSFDQNKVPISDNASASVEDTDEESTSTILSRKKSNKIGEKMLELEQTKINMLKRKLETQPKEDPDRDFLISLLPYIHELNSLERMELRQKIQSDVLEALQNHELQKYVVYE